jgi:hypothetical protein
VFIKVTIRVTSHSKILSPSSGMGSPFIEYGYNFWWYKNAPATATAYAGIFYSLIHPLEGT